MIEFSYRTRQTWWAELKNNPEKLHDVVIMGGGIVGAGFLRQLALAGLKDVYLFEKNDFASGTSGGSSKLIHAGLRYLEQVWNHFRKGQVFDAWKNFCFVWNASQERKKLRRMATHLVWPKTIHVVLGKDDKRPAWTFILGVWIYYVIQLLQGQFSARPRSWCGEQIGKNFPELNFLKTKLVVSFSDSETDDARLVVETLKEGCARGGHALNYVEVVSYTKVDAGFLLTLRESIHGESISIRTKVLVNSTGPWIDETRDRDLQHLTHSYNLVDRVAGAHLDIYPAISARSFYVTADDGRLVFVLHRQEGELSFSRVGTTERKVSDSEPSDRIAPSEQEESYLKKLVQAYFPRAIIDSSTIMRRDEAIRPLVRQDNLHAFDKSREHLIVEENGVFHLVGVKLTDFRRVADELRRTIPWDRYGIRLAESIDEDTYQNTESLYSRPLPEKVVNYLMVIREEDALLRRLGLWPLVIEKTEPARFQKFVSELKTILGASRL